MHFFKKIGFIIAIAASSISISSFCMEPAPTIMSPDEYNQAIMDEYNQAIMSLDEYKQAKEYYEKNSQHIFKLLQQGILPDYPNLLINAALCADLQVIKLLMKRDDIDFKKKDKNGNHALIAAIDGGNKEIVKLLLEKIDVDEPTENGLTALIYASELNDTDIMEILINAGADINNQNNSQKHSPLMHAARLLSCDAVQLLLEYNADAHLVCVDNLTALEYAKIVENMQTDGKKTTEMQEHYKKIVEMLSNPQQVKSKKRAQSKDKKEKKSDKENSDEDAEPTLEATESDNEENEWTYAARKGDHEKIKSLIASNPKDVDSCDTDGVTALSWACIKGHNVIAALLLDAGANPNMQEDDGEYPLMHAVIHNNIRLVELLLEAGASVVKIKDNDDETILDVARRVIKDDFLTPHDKQSKKEKIQCNSLIIGLLTAKAEEESKAIAEELMKEEAQVQALKEKEKQKKQAKKAKQKAKKKLKQSQLQASEMQPKKLTHAPSVSVQVTTRLNAPLPIGKAVTHFEKRPLQTGSQKPLSIDLPTNDLAQVNEPSPTHKISNENVQSESNQFTILVKSPTDEIVSLVESEHDQEIQEDPIEPKIIKQLNEKIQDLKKLLKTYQSIQKNIKRCLKNKDKLLPIQLEQCTKGKLTLEKQILVVKQGIAELTILLNQYTNKS
jgi:ankyrin repeat protein